MTEEIPFSRPVKVETLPRDGLTQKIAASPEERSALAAVNELADLSELTANFTLKRAGRIVRLTGTVHAEVSQVCVVSLDPFPATIDEEVDLRFARVSEAKPRDEPETIDLDAEDPPDPIIDGKVDLGAVAAEALALALDPYPRKPGAEFKPPAEPEAPDSPFAELARIAKLGQ